jgi:hypothetical protein
MTHHVDLSTIVLKSGKHSRRSKTTVCLLEAVAWWAHEPHSDHPTCVSPVLGAFGRSWNDALNDDDRQMLVPFIPKLMGTNTGAADDETRAWMATDWLVRVHTPAWLRLAGLTTQAELLESLAELNPETCPKIMPVLKAVRSDAAAARDAARAAAGAAARAAAGAAAWAAARDAARAAARDAAWAAAARDALRPTVEALQASALELFDRMCQVGAAVPA